MSVCVCVDTPVYYSAYQPNYTLVKVNHTSLASHAVIPVKIPVVIPVIPASDLYTCESTPLAAVALGSPPRAPVVYESSPLAAVIYLGPYSSHCLV